MRASSPLAHESRDYAMKLHHLSLSRRPFIKPRQVVPLTPGSYPGLYLGPNAQPVLITAPDVAYLIAPKSPTGIAKLFGPAAVAAAIDYQAAVVKERTAALSAYYAIKNVTDPAQIASLTAANASRTASILAAAEAARAAILNLSAPAQPEPDLW